MYNETKINMKERCVIIINQNEFNSPEDKKAWDFVKKLADIQKKSIDEFEGISLLNPIQSEKFEKALLILERYAESNKTKVDVDMHPPEQHGFLSVKISMVDVYGEKLEEFKELIDCANVFSVESVEDGDLIIGINVNNVWKRKSL